MYQSTKEELFMEVYKKSYTGFVVWFIGFCVVVVGACFLPNLGTQLTLAVVDNASTIGIFILTLLIYQTESVYWYNGTSYEDAKAVGSERRKAFALAHMKRFGYLALIFLAYSVVSLMVGIPYGFDVAIACAGILIVALSTIKLKL